MRTVLRLLIAVAALAAFAVPSLASAASTAAVPTLVTEAGSGAPAPTLGQSQWRLMVASSSDSSHALRDPSVWVSTQLAES